MSKSSGEKRGEIYFQVKDAWANNDVATIFRLAYEKGQKDMRKALVKSLQEAKIENFIVAKEVTSKHWSKATLHNFVLQLAINIVKGYKP